MAVSLPRSLPPAPSDGRAAVCPARPSHLARSDTVTMREHRQLVAELVQQHADEIRRSDVVHARYSNNLTSAVAEAARERDAARDEGVELEENLLAAQRRVGRLERDVEREEQRRRAAQAAARPARRDAGAELELDSAGEADLRAEAARLREENGQLLREKERAVLLAHKGEEATKRRVAELRAEQAGACREHDDLTRRLAEGTADFRDLDQSYQELEARALGGKQQYLDLQQELRRRDEVRASLLQQAAMVEDAQREAAQRTAARTANGTTPLDILLEDLRAVEDTALAMQQQLRA